jgi:hypothetical protein
MIDQAWGSWRPQPAVRSPESHLSTPERLEVRLGAMSKVAIAADFVSFLAKRKRYWLLPMALTLLLLGLLVVLTEGSAVAPFIYTLF